MIPSLFKRKGCGCKSYAKKMDKWGVEGCRDRYDRIVRYIRVKARRFGIPDFAGNLTRTVVRGWVTDAIQKADDKRTKGTNRATTPAVPTARKRREKLRTVVWVYWHGGADSDELLHSMRSVQANLSGVRNIVVCGDHPGDWYMSNYLGSPRFGKAQAKEKYGSGRWAKWCDSIIKLKAIINSDMVTDEFLWMYDDTFIVKPTSISELAVGRVGGQLYKGDLDEPVRRTWREARRRTARHLRDLGMPAVNFSTHFPMVFEKKKLAKTIEMFGCPDSPRLIESIYGNQWITDSRPASEIFQYTHRPGPDWKIHERAKVVNVGGFNRNVRPIMAEMFPPYVPKSFLQEPAFATVKRDSQPMPIVTSVSPKPGHIDRQYLSLDSWKRAGYRIHAMNTTEEIKILRERYGDVDEWHACDEVRNDYDCPTQRLYNMFGLSRELGKVMVMNSDIEIRNPEPIVTDDKTIGLGIRWEHGEDMALASEFKWGIDAITCTAEQHATLPPEMPFSIGQAMWDYAIPDLLRRAGYQIYVDHTIRFFHRRHVQFWNHDGWEFGAKWMCENGCFPLSHTGLSEEFRQSLETTHIWSDILCRYIDKDSGLDPDAEERQRLLIAKHSASPP